MSSQKPKAGNSKTPIDDYESTILDFLDKEISASAETVRDSNTQRDEVEAMVSDLLKQTIADSDERDLPQETKPVDLDSLFTDILNIRVEAAQEKSQLAPLEVDPKPGEPLTEVVLADQESANLCPVESEPDQKTEILSGGEIPQVIREAVAEPATVPGTLSLPSSPIFREGSGHPTPSATACHMPSVRERATLFALASPTHSRRVLVVGAALLCLLLGIGVVVHDFTGHTGSTSSKLAKPAPSTATLPSATEGVTVPSPTTQDSGIAVKSSAVQPPNPTQSTPADPEARDSLNGPAPTPNKEDTEAAIKSPAPLSKSAPAVNTATPAASVDRTGSGVTAAGNGEANPKPQIPEDAEPPATIIAHELPPSIPARPASATSPIWGAITPGSMSPVRPSASTKVAPPVLISQVRPVYPETARRMHLTGTILLDIQIDEQGRVVKATPVNGPPLLRFAAAEAVLKWRYKPASIGETAVRSQGQISVVFNNP